MRVGYYTRHVRHTMPGHAMSTSEFEQKPRAMELPFYGFVCVEGAKAGEFLQGQLSCDLRQACAQRVLPGAYCTVKGRVSSSFLLWQSTPERFLLRMRADIVEPTIALLAKYGVFSRVRIGVASPELRCIGLLDPDIAERLGADFPEWPPQAGALAGGEGMYLVRRDDAGSVCELWVEQDRYEVVLALIAGRLPVATADCWRLALVRAGAAEVQLATREQFLPQMLGYDRTGAVSFRKGCYTGQEIVARTHYKGALKRHLQHLECSGCGGLEPGSQLLHGSSGRGVGTVLEIAPSGSGNCELLAVVSNDALDAQLLAAPDMPMRLLAEPRAMI